MEVALNKIKPARYAGEEKNRLPSKFANYCQFLRDNGLQPHYGLESSLHQRPLHGSAAPITALTGLALEQRLDALHQHLLAS